MDDDAISRQKAIDAHYEYCNKHPDAAFPVWSLKILEDLSSAEPEVIRCKDCKYWDTNGDWAGDGCYCPNVDGMRESDFYCADAERRADETD